MSLTERYSVIPKNSPENINSLLGETVVLESGKHINLTASMMFQQHAGLFSQSLDHIIIRIDTAFHRILECNHRNSELVAITYKSLYYLSGFNHLAENNNRRQIKRSDNIGKFELQLCLP